MKKNLLSLSLLVAISMLVAACGAGSGYKRIMSGNMPDTGTWDGVYHSEAYGRMELTDNSGTVIGLYEGERYHGKIEGTSKGNVLNFKWTQWNEDLNGKTRETSGHGYFKYVIKEEGTASKSRPTHYAEGEWGYLDANSGNLWVSVKFPVGTKKILTVGDKAPSSDDGNANPFAAPAGSSTSSSSDSAPADGGGSSFDSGGGGLSEDVGDLF